MSALTDRNQRGRFLPGNQTAARGGQARAAKLPPKRRQEIARAGWQAFVERHFAGDEQAAGEYIGQLGAWAAEQVAYADSPIYQPVWTRPILPGGAQ